MTSKIKIKQKQKQAKKDGRIEVEEKAGDWRWQLDVMSCDVSVKDDSIEVEEKVGDGSWM